MKTLSVLLIVFSLFSCKKERSQVSEELVPETFYEDFIRKNMTALPVLTPATPSSKNLAGFVSFKDAYDYYNTRKIVGMRNSKVVKINKEKNRIRTASTASIARNLFYENVWYFPTVVYTGASIGNATWPTYVYINVDATPFATFTYRVDLFDVKEYYILNEVDMNFANAAYLLNGLGTVQEMGSPTLSPNLIKQLLQHNYTVAGIPFSSVIDYWLSCEGSATLPTWDMPPAEILLSYTASGIYL
ncbi:hypothetical protein [Pseudoflavitalea rhizosphaerae]|uniref:hypothetical protein n=1 Tax=Pseudoflavitalea rhizosphaerae TaxID=1884793 RepID=UPI000F8E3F6A|nr:hypothetical protein [Pseudoflavitalea rhizosphaerae]